MSRSPADPAQARQPGLRKSGRNGARSQPNGDDGAGPAVHQDDEDPKFSAAPTILSWYGTLCSRHLPLFSCFLYAVLGPNF